MVGLLAILTIVGRASAGASSITSKSGNVNVYVDFMYPQAYILKEKRNAKPNLSFSSSVANRALTWVFWGVQYLHLQNHLYLPTTQECWGW